MLERDETPSRPRPTTRDRWRVEAEPVTGLERVAFAVEGAARFAAGGRAQAGGYTLRRVGELQLARG